MHTFITRGLSNHGNKVVREAMVDVFRSRTYAFYKRYILGKQKLLSSAQE